MQLKSPKNIRYSENSSKIHSTVYQSPSLYKIFSPKSKINLKQADIKGNRKQFGKKHMNNLSSIKIEQRLKNEIKNIIQQINSISLKNILKQQKFTQKQQIIALDKNIQEKTQIIKHLNSQIDIIKKTQRHLTEEQSRSHKNSTDQNQKIADKILENVKLKQHTLFQLFKQNEKLINIYSHQKKAAEILQEKYIRHSNDYSYSQKVSNIMTFDQFKQKNIYKHSGKSKQIKHIQKPNYMTSSNQKNQKKQQQKHNNTIQQLQQKLQITYNAIKTAKKKHALQIYQLNQKLQFLKDQDHQLESRIKQKKQELQKKQKQFKQEFNQKRSNSAKKISSFKKIVKQ